MQSINVTPGVPGTAGPRAIRALGPQVVATQDFVISGVTKDLNGNILGGCTVQLFNSASSAFLNQTISDPTTGAYRFYVATGLSFYLIAYKAGSPDVAGTTLNTLAGV